MIGKALLFRSLAAALAVSFAFISILQLEKTKSELLTKLGAALKAVTLKV